MEEEGGSVEVEKAATVVEILAGVNGVAVFYNVALFIICCMMKHFALLLFKCFQF